MSNRHNVAKRIISLLIQGVFLFSKAWLILLYVLYEIVAGLHCVRPSIPFQCWLMNLSKVHLKGNFIAWFSCSLASSCKPPKTGFSFYELGYLLLFSARKRRWGGLYSTSSVRRVTFWLGSSYRNVNISLLTFQVTFISFLNTLWVMWNDRIQKKWWFCLADYVTEVIFHFPKINYSNGPSIYKLSDLGIYQK